MDNEELVEQLVVEAKNANSRAKEWLKGQDSFNYHLELGKAMAYEHIICVIRANPIAPRYTIGEPMKEAQRLGSWKHSY